jgi:hypothetical protein
MSAGDLLDDALDNLLVASRRAVDSSGGVDVAVGQLTIRLTPRRPAAKKMPARPATVTVLSGVGTSSARCSPDELHLLADVVTVAAVWLEGETKQ